MLKPEIVKRQTKIRHRETDVYGNSNCNLHWQVKDTKAVTLADPVNTANGC